MKEFDHNMQKTGKNAHLNQLYSAVIVLMPILNIYSAGISSLGIGDVLGVITIVHMIMSNKGIIRTTERQYGRFALYFVMVSFLLTIIIREYSFVQFLLKGLRFAVYTVLIICFGRNRFDVEFGFNLYIKISVIAAVYLIVQYVCKTAFSITLPITIPYLKLTFSDSTGAAYNEELLSMYSIFGYRAPGFFKEPAHFCQYVVLSIALLLFKSSRDKKRVVSLIIVIAAIILSYSAIGYISMMSTIVIWFAYTFKKRRMVNNIVLMIIGSAALAYFSIRSGALSSAISRINSITYSHAATGNMRLLRGFYVYREMPLLYKIIGIGCGNYSAFIDKYQINTFFDARLDRYSEYMSGVSCVMVNSGLLGFGLYLFALLDIYKKTALVQKVMFASFLVLIIATSSFFSITYVMYLVFLVADITAHTGRELD